MKIDTYFIKGSRIKWYFFSILYLTAEINFELVLALRKLKNISGILCLSLQPAPRISSLLVVVPLKHFYLVSPTFAHKRLKRKSFEHLAKQQCKKVGHYKVYTFMG